MQNEILIINTDKEATNEEVKILEQCFKKNKIKIKINKSSVRLSKEILPLFISFTLTSILSGLIYDLVKKLVNELKSKIKRKFQIEIQKNDKLYYFTNEKYWIRDKSNNTTYKSYQELLNELKININNNVILYQTDDNKVILEVQIENDTVWLTQLQMAELFNQTKQNISLHINNIFKENELKEKSVVKKSLTTASDGKKYNVNMYNLDVIISVGYRVKSRRGTHFRIWATSILKEHLINGYTINEKRLLKEKEKFNYLQRSIDIINDTLRNQQLQLKDSKDLIQLISDFSYALSILDDYDHNSLTIRNITKKKCYRLSYEECKQIIEYMKKTFSSSDIFGVEKDDSFKGSIGNIYQTFDGKDLYGSIEEKSANLLYFITKNHSFIDGNKRIASTIFIYFLNKNDMLYDLNGKKRIPDNSLVAMTLMIAESKPTDKDIIIKVIVNLINKNN